MSKIVGKSVEKTDIESVEKTDNKTAEQTVCKMAEKANKIPTITQQQKVNYLPKEYLSDLNSKQPYEKFATSSDIIINNQIKECLIDSGAQTSFIDDRYVVGRAFRRHEIFNMRNWVTANGSPLEIRGQTDLTLRIGSKEFNHTFVIARNLSHDVIIGTDFLLPNEFILNFKDKLLQSGENYVKIKSFSRINSNINSVSIIEQVDIGPFSKVKCWANIDKKLPEVLYFHSNDKIVSEGLVTNIDGRISLVFSNPTGLNKTLMPNTIIGHVESCQIISSINSTESLNKYLLEENFEIEKICPIKINNNNNSNWRPSEQININNPSLNKSQIKKLKNLIDKYSIIFSKDDEDLGRLPSKYGEHDIILENERPNRQRPYKTPYTKEKVVDACIEKMLKMRVIEPSNSDWASPIVLVKKQDGSERFCVDYRKVNLATVKDSFPMPAVEDKLNKLAGCKIFSKLDCTSGYWQIGLTERAKRITAFICKQGLFQFNVMPFGLCNAGSTFQRVVENIIGNLKNTTGYIDDIFTYSKSFEEHLDDLEQIFIRLKEANIKIKTKKCEIATEETKFLGYLVTKNGIQIDPSRSESIKKYPRPQTKKNIKEFLGLANYYRQFIPKFADIVDPLNQLTREKVRFKWSDECELAFKTMLELLSSSPILAYPNFERQFHLTTDASVVGLGAVISQFDENNIEHPIFYASRSLNSAERNYSTIERELLAIVFGVDKFRYYLLGKKFKIHTDHNPLTYLNNLTLSSARLTRWRLKLAEFDFDVIYKKGILNSNADALSRIEVEQTSKQDNIVAKDDIIEALFSITNDNIIEDLIIYKNEEFISKDVKIIALCSPFEINKVKNGILNKFLKMVTDPSKLSNHDTPVGGCFFQAITGGRTLACLITKNSAKDTSSYQQLEKCLNVLLNFCLKNKINIVAFPKIESGMDKLSWKRVASLINKILIRNRIECQVYTNIELDPNSRAAAELNEFEKNSLKIDKDIRVMQNADTEISKLIQKTKKGELKGYVIEDDILFKLRKARYKRIFKQLVVPKILRNEVLKMCHDDFTGAHLGQSKTLTKLQNRFYWPNSYKEALNYVESCEICAKLKNAPPKRANLKPIIDFKYPFDKVGLDILELSRTSSGNKYCLVFTDYLTKWVEAFPMRNMEAETIAKIFINEFVTRHSAPSELLTDQGQNFRSNLIQNICDYLKTKKIFTTPYNPKCDGLTERFNKTLCHMLAAYSNSNQTNWDLYLPLVLYAYRTSEQKSTGISPFEAVYGRNPRLGDLDNYNKECDKSNFVENLHWRWREIKAKIEEAAEINKEIYENKNICMSNPFRVGEFVRIKRQETKPGLKKKLRNDFWSDPVEITKINSDQNITVKWNENEKTVHIDNVKRKEPNRFLSLIN